MNTTPFSVSISNLRFGEFDLGGVLYHANYFHVYEMAREAFLAAGPVPYSELVRQESHLAVVETRQKFLQPISYGEEFTVELSVSELNRASVTVEYKFIKEHIAHLGLTKLVFVQPKAGRLSVSPLPPELKAHFQNYLSRGHFGE